jgi:DNA-binding NarL/FixJ family response regulator/signal transduction histidine kinase
VYLTPAAVGYLTQLILAALISGYFLCLLRQPGRVPHIVWLSGFFVALTGFIATLFLEAALLPTPRLYAVFLQNTLLGAALTCLLQFAYHFPVQTASRRRETRLALYLSGLYTLWEAGYAVFRFAQLRAGHILYRPAWSDYALLLFLFWTPLSFLRKMRALSPNGGGWKHGGELSFHPPARETRARRGFAWIFLFVASLSLFNILRGVYLLSVALANLGISLGILFALFSFAVTYLNYRPETTSFMIKLVGVTLTVVLAIMGVVGWIVSPAYEAHYRPTLLDRRTLRFTPNEAGGYTIVQVPFTFAREQGRKLALAEDAAHTCSGALNFPFPFYGQTYSQVYVCNDGAVSLGQSMAYRMYQYRYGAGAPLILPLLTDLYPEISAGGVFVQQEPERLIVTWDRMRGFRQQGSEFTFQAILYSNGVFDFSYDGLPEHLVYHPNDDPGASVWAVGALPGGLERRARPQLVTWTDLPLSSGPDGVLEDYRLEFRQHLHRLFAPLTGLILAASVLIVAGFPLLFYITLVNPLNALLRGVRRIEAGDYASRVPVQYMDEVGFLTRAFNALAAQLGDLIRTLEARVAARTAELDAANTQLRAEIAERERAQATLIEQQRALATFEERERLGRELHDGLGQVMGYINVQAQAIQNLLDGEKTQAARNNLDDLARAAQKAHADIRSHILGLRMDEPPAPDFSTTVRDYVHRFGEQFGIAVSLSLPDDAPVPLFAPGVEEQVLRIVQEALTNVRKHARAARVEVVFSLIGDQVQLLIADDGVGFTPPPLTPPQWGGQRGGEAHFGLDIMHERAEQIGGRLEIRSVLGEGTRILATLPRFLPAGVEGEEAGIKGLRLLLADDHPLFLDGLRNLLLARGLTVVGTAHDGQEALEKARALRPDVVVMDLQMPRCNGLEATRAIKAELPGVKIVILTVSEDEASLFEAIKSGASGYLIKSLEANQFCSLLTGLMRGEAPLSPGLAERILAEFTRVASPPVVSPVGEAGEALTPRQREILGLVAQGVIYKEIGERLHLSEKTIKYHMGQILGKLHVESRAQAISYFYRARKE